MALVVVLIILVNACTRYRSCLMPLPENVNASLSSLAQAPPPSPPPLLHAMATPVASSSPRQGPLSPRLADALAEGKLQEQANPAAAAAGIPGVPSCLQNSGAGEDEDEDEGEGEGEDTFDGGMERGVDVNAKGADHVDEAGVATSFILKKNSKKLAADSSIVPKSRERGPSSSFLQNRSSSNRVDGGASFLQQQRMIRKFQYRTMNSNGEGTVPGQRVKSHDMDLDRAEEAGILLAAKTGDLPLLDLFLEMETCDVDYTDYKQVCGCGVCVLWVWVSCVRAGSLLRVGVEAGNFGVKRLCSGWGVFF